MFKGINIESLNFLIKELHSLLKKYIISNHISEFAILDRNLLKVNNCNSKERSRILNKDYPDIFNLDQFIDDYYYYCIGMIDDITISLDDKFYSWKDLSSLITNHNNSVIIPKSSELLVQKRLIYEWGDYNTPGLKDVRVTPMVGTSAESMSRDPLFIYNEWIIASHYLLKEYNIWSKAKFYIEKAKLDNSVLNSIEYKQAYHYFILRQFMINQTKFPYDNKDYIKDFTQYNYIYRELCEDLLYILLNLLLANKIVGNKSIEELLNNKEEFIVILTNIIKNHYNQYNNAYKCLESLRWYALNNYFSYNQINKTYNSIKKT